MKNVYLVLGGIIILAAGFAGGYVYRELMLKQNETAGVVIAKDSGSVTLKLADDSVRTVQFGPDTIIVMNQAPLPALFEDIAVGADVQASVADDGTASFVLVTPADSSTAQ